MMDADFWEGAVRRIDIWTREQTEAEMSAPVARWHVVGATWNGEDDVVFYVDGKRLSAGAPKAD
jgi:hypothetical protein